MLAPHVDRVVIANPKQVRLIAHAKIKTDAIDATVLAKLYATGFLPEVWVPDEATLALRRQIARRIQLIRQRVRLKNLIQSILRAHLIPSCPHGNVTGISGRKWIAAQRLPDDERTAVHRHLAQIDLIEKSLKDAEADTAQAALSDPVIRRLMTLPGVDMTVASGVAAAIGDVRRSEDPTKLVGYLGLNPSTRQSGEGPAYHGRITDVPGRIGSSSTSRPVRLSCCLSSSIGFRLRDCTRDRRSDRLPDDADQVDCLSHERQGSDVLQGAGITSRQRPPSRKLVAGRSRPASRRRPADLANYESGRSRIPIAVLLAMAETLHFSIDDMLQARTPGHSKRGPVSRLERQIEAVSQLPKSRQRVIADVLDGLLARKQDARTAWAIHKLGELSTGGDKLAYRPSTLWRARYHSSSISGFSSAKHSRMRCMQWASSPRARASPRRGIGQCRGSGA